MLLYYTQTQIAELTKWELNKTKMLKGLVADRNFSLDMFRTRHHPLNLSRVNPSLFSLGGTSSSFHLMTNIDLCLIWFTSSFARSPCSSSSLSDVSPLCHRSKLTFNQAGFCSSTIRRGQNSGHRRNNAHSLINKIKKESIKFLNHGLNFC